MSFTGKTETFLNTTLANDGFFPDLSLREFQEVYRVPAEFKQEMIESKLRAAVIECNGILQEKKTEWLVSFTTLAGVSADEIGSKNILVEHYKAAVFCKAKAKLLREFATVNRRQEAENLAKESETAEDDYLTQANRAIRRLLGVKANITVELL